MFESDQSIATFKEIEVFGKKYEMFAHTVHLPGHFYTVFDCDPAIRYDGLSPPNKIHQQVDDSVSSVWYVEKIDLTDE